MQSKAPDVDAIMAWNPHVLQTLKVRTDARVLFDSKGIPGEIIDLVVVGQDVLDRPGGKEFACALIDTFYEFNRMLDDPQQRDALLGALGEKFAHLEADDMRKAVGQSPFYKTTDDALELFTGEKLPEGMKRVTRFCVSRNVIPQEPRVGYGPATDAPDAELRFDPSYIRIVRDRQKYPALRPVRREERAEPLQEVGEQALGGRQVVP